MVTYNFKKKELVALFDLTGKTINFTDFIVPLQQKSNYFFNPSYWKKNENNIYVSKYNIPVNFNIIINVGNYLFETIIGLQKNDTLYYIFQDNGGINRNENSYKSKEIFLLEDSFLTIQTGTDQTISKRFFYGNINEHSYNGFIIYLTI